MQRNTGAVLVLTNQRQAVLVYLARNQRIDQGWAKMKDAFRLNDTIQESCWLDVEERRARGLRSTRHDGVLHTVGQLSDGERVAEFLAMCEGQRTTSAASTMVCCN